MSINKGDNIIDSRDVEKKIEELQDQFSGTPFANSDYSSVRLKEILNETPIEWREACECWDESEIEELIYWVEFKEEGEGYSDWIHGATFIADEHFQDYAQELAEEIGAINRNESWPNNCIDWEQAANELKQDYTAIEVDGDTYWVR